MNSIDPIDRIDLTDPRPTSRIALASTFTAATSLEPNR